MFLSLMSGLMPIGADDSTAAGAGNRPSRWRACYFRLMRAAFRRREFCAASRGHDAGMAGDQTIREVLLPQ
jgi:hypothetical protein